MGKLLYQGHGSFRITTNKNVIIYVDPYVGEGYDVPADIILVTHQHVDHNQIHLVTQNSDCTVITNKEALDGGVHNTFECKAVKITAVEASNKNHSSKECVGYIIDFDSIKLYAAGDSSKTKQMEKFKELELDYALLPCDGVYNMDLTESAECAKIIGAKNNIPIHMKPGKLFDMGCAQNFNAPNRMIIEPGQEITI